MSVPAEPARRRFRPYEGSVEAPYSATSQEISSDLLAVIEAVELKPVRLTKSGIPPKPLWTAINHRLIWKDPTGILYDWEEADQVRFCFRLATGLDLVRADAELWLGLGPGADAYFLANPLERSRMLLRAYLDLDDWDERCDARGQEGHRHNFGQAFRRDFVHDVKSLRLAALGLLSRMPRGWVDLTEMARALSAEVPDLLLSEVCTIPELPEDGVDPEKLRFLRYWFTLLGRFGWADLGRAERPGGALRLCRLTPLGAALFSNEPFDDVPEQEIRLDEDLVLLPNGDVMSPSARFVSRRMGERLDAPRGRAARYRISPASLRAAAENTFDLFTGLDWLERHTAEPVPAEPRQWVEDVMAARTRARIVRAVAAVEVSPDNEFLARRLSELGFVVSAGLALASGRQVPALFSSVGGEPNEGFDYPPDEPLGGWRKSSPVLQLYYEVLPLTHRDLLKTLGAAGDPPAVEFTAEKVAALRAGGWTLAALSEALEQLTLRPIPSRVKRQLEAMFA